MTDLETRLRTTLARTAADTAVPPLPDLDAAAAQRALRPVRRRTTGRRVAAAAAVSCLVAAGGVGVAAAAGLFAPQPVGHDAFGTALYRAADHRHLSPVADDPGPDYQPYAVPGTKRTVLTARGPDGSTMRLDVARSSSAGVCLFEDDQDGASGSASTCIAPSDRLHVDLEGAEGNSDTDAELISFAAEVPGATTVRVTFSDGSRSAPLPVARDVVGTGVDVTIGFVDRPHSLLDPVLTGYDAHGAVIGRVPLNPPTHPVG